MKKEYVISIIISLLLSVYCFAQSTEITNVGSTESVNSNTPATVYQAKAAPAALTYTLVAGYESWPEAKRTAIVKAMDEALVFYNNNGYFAKALTVDYNPAVPTADAGYNGRIRFGGSISTRTAMHEISHTLGVGTNQWYVYADLTTNTWLGTHANARLKLYNGQDAIVKVDKMHFWSSTGSGYGLNYATQDGATIRHRHFRLVSAFRWDMGIVKDSDNDGLPDDWEMFNFGMLNYNGSDDNDGDGISNLQEYNADTNPNSKFEWVKVDDRDASITYDANWGKWPSDPSYNTTSSYCNVTGATATYSFTGTKVRYYGFKRNNLGIADIYLDNELKASVDCYAAITEPDFLLFESDSLEYGAHTLKIVVSGNKNPSSPKAEIICDAFEYLQGEVVNSTKSINANNKFKIYPNPAKDNFNISTQVETVSKLSVFDLMGRNVYQNTFKGDMQISTDEMPGAGMYFIHLSTGKNTYVEKITIQ